MRRKPGSASSALILPIAIFTIFLSAGCHAPAEKEKFPVFPAMMFPVGYQTNTFAGSGYSFQYPDSWEVDDEDTAAIVLYDNKNNTGFINNLSITVSDSMPDIARFTREDYDKTVKNLSRELNEQLVPGKWMLYTLNGKDALLMNYKGTVNNIDATIFVLCVSESADSNITYILSFIFSNVTDEDEQIVYAICSTFSIEQNELQASLTGDESFR